ncbi:reverse transcriptase domain-containing protein [Tanacetum coccineum]
MIMVLKTTHHGPSDAKHNPYQLLRLLSKEYGESNVYALDDPTIQAENPVKEILLKLNLPDHRSRSKITSMQKDLQKNSQKHKASRLKTSQESHALSTQLDSGLVVPSFLPNDDLIVSLKKAMMFLSTAMNSIFPPNNNQLRTSSNPRTQATVQDDRVTVQNIQGHRSQGYGVNTGNSQATGTRVINTVGKVKANQSRVIRSYNCKGEGHIAKQCTMKKRVKDSEWFKEKMLLAQAHESRVILLEEQQDFLVDSNVISYADYTVTIENDAAQYVPPPEQNNAMILSVNKQMQSQLE